jgi:hypothetical protein
MQQSSSPCRTHPSPSREGILLRLSGSVPLPGGARGGLLFCAQRVTHHGESALWCCRCLAYDVTLSRHAQRRLANPSSSGEDSHSGWADRLLLLAAESLRENLHVLARIFLGRDGPKAKKSGGSGGPALPNWVAAKAHLGKSPWCYRRTDPAGAGRAW